MSQTLYKMTIFGGPSIPSGTSLYLTKVFEEVSPDLLVPCMEVFILVSRLA